MQGTSPGRLKEDPKPQRDKVAQGSRMGQGICCDWVGEQADLAGFEMSLRAQEADSYTPLPPKNARVPSPVKPRKEDSGNLW